MAAGFAAGVTLGVPAVGALAEMSGVDAEVEVVGVKISRSEGWDMRSPRDWTVPGSRRSTSELTERLVP